MLDELKEDAIEKGIEGTAQAIIVELVGGEVPEDVGARKTTWTASSWRRQ